MYLTRGAEGCPSSITVVRSHSLRVEGRLGSMFGSRTRSLQGSATRKVSEVEAGVGCFRRASAFLSPCIQHE